MGLETATFISSLVGTNPIATDKKRQGDDHLRLIKDVLQATFPNAAKAFYFPTTESKTADFSVLSTDMNKTFLVSTGTGEVAATLPSLVAGDAGWTCHFVKTNTGTNALFIAPASGTLQSGEVSGLAKCRRVIPGHRCSAIWDGTVWYVTRVPNVPVGSCIEFHGATLPVGYEWPNGQTLTSASTKYPEFYSVNGSSGVTLDRCGRVGLGKDDMGEASNNRVTAAGCGIDGDTLGAAGGAETHTLTEAQLATHSHGVTDPGHAHGTTATIYASGAMPNAPPSGILTHRNDAGTITVAGALTSISINNAGSGSAHNNMPPAIVVNLVLVVE